MPDTLESKESCLSCERVRRKVQTQMGKEIRCSVKSQLTIDQSKRLEAILGSARDQAVSDEVVAPYSGEIDRVHCPSMALRCAVVSVRGW